MRKSDGADGVEAPTGRELFRRFRGAIAFACAFLRLLPRSLQATAWRLVEGLPGVIGAGARYCVLKVRAQSCGDNVMIGPDVEIRGWEHLSIGSNVSIHRGCYIDAVGGVTIRDDVSVAHGSSILSFEHTWDDPFLPIKYNPVRLSAVTIDNDVWIGCGCRILAGTRIHSRSIVAAGAVVTRDVPARSVVGGVPAKVLKSIAEPATSTRLG